MGTFLKFTTAYHPLSDGQTERVNRCLESYLKCMTSYAPKKWAYSLPLAEWWCSTNFYQNLKLTPFEALYGYAPPQYIIPTQVKTPNAMVEGYMQDRLIMAKLVKETLMETQNRMKQMADRHRTEREFEEGS